MREASAKSGLSDLRKLSRAREPEHGHGSIPPPRFPWKTRILVPTVIVGGLASLFLWKAVHVVFPPVSVRVSPVVVKPLKGPVAGSVAVQAAGWVEADPYTSYVAALTDGIVREVLVLEGERVERDQIVARLVNDDAKLAFQRAEAEVRQEEAALEAARAALTAARTEWDHPVDRKHVLSVAEAELRENRALLEQMTAEIEVEEAQLERTRSDYERAVPLHGSAAISEAEFVRVRAQFNAQGAKARASKERKTLIEARIAKFEADLVAAQNHMTLRTEERHKLDRTQATMAQTQAALERARVVRDEAKLRLDRTQIRSPVAGLVMKRLASPGSKVLIGSDEKHSAHVLTLYDPDRLQVRVDVPLADAAKVGVGQAAEVVVEVLPQRVFSGTVKRVLHEANIQKNTLEVKVAIDKPEPQLRPEMLARVRFLAQVQGDPDQVRPAIFVPAEAIRKGASGSGAWVVRDLRDDLGTVHFQSVEVGHGAVDGWVEVIKGLQPAEMIVTHTPVELHKGKRVRVTIQ